MRIEVHSDDHVGEAVTVHVAGAPDGPAELLAVGVAFEGEERGLRGEWRGEC
jgi:hypothetical protein